MNRVLSMGKPMSSVTVALLVALAIMFHGGAAAGATAAALFAEIAMWHKSLRDSLNVRLSQLYEVELQKEPPPPEEKKEEVKEEAPPAPKEPPPPQAPPPAPAEAAKVIATDPDPLDFTGDTIVQGNAEQYAGGTTKSDGTSKKAVDAPQVVSTGTPGGTGAPNAPPPVDRSRAASLANKANLERCPFPSEADAEQIDDAYVTVEVNVRVDGSAEAVKILQDPGHGFGREARKCALRERYTNALDFGGNAVPGVSRIRFHFQR
jgi:protein TonB